MKVSDRIKQIRRQLKSTSQIECELVQLEAEIADAPQAAKQEGYLNGYRDGYSGGYEDGYQAGYKVGHVAGYDDVMNAANGR